MPVRDVAERATVRRAFAVCVDRGFTRIDADEQQPRLDVADIDRTRERVYCGFAKTLTLVVAEQHRDRHVAVEEIGKSVAVAVRVAQRQIGRASCRERVCQYE